MALTPGPYARSERARMAVPTRLLPALVAARAKAEWRRPAVREDAVKQMRFVLERARPDADIDEAARAYVRYQARRGELRWHPELITSLPVVGVEGLLAARSAGRGVILNFMHHGYYDGAFPSIARHGVENRMVVYPYMLEPDAPSWLRQHVKVACVGGGTPVSAAVGTAGMIDLLARGEVVALASDVPGRTPLRFLGRDVLGSFGAARLAFDAGAPVVVLTTEEGADGPFVRLHGPFEPADHASARELLDVMLAIHESVILRWPEATDLPLSRWGQVDDASPPTVGGS